MKKITQNLRWLVTLLAMIVCTGAWAEETTIATATFDGKNATYTTGWTTTGTGKGRTDCVIIGAGENITSPAFNLSGYSSVTITFTGRRYGTLSDSKATVDASIGGTSVGTIDFTPTKVGVIEGGITFTPTPSMTAASLVFTCTNATSAGSTHGAGIGSITIKGTTSGGTVVTKTLTSIAISGTYPTTFQQGDAFSHEGMTVTATYDDESTADATSKATFSGYNMSSVGEQTVTVTYVEGEVAKTASYTITVNKKAPVIDYATLPFEFNGGKGDIETTTGLTQNGLGNDYSADNSKLKFDTTDDYLILKINESPGVLSFNITNNSFSGGTFKVQTSKDGETYTDLKTYTTISGTQSESIDNLSSDVRFIKWVYTEKSTGNVGLGNIKLERSSTAPQIIVANTTINVDANENSGTLEVTYKNIDTKLAEIHFYEADGETAATYDWIVAELDGNNNIEYLISANEGEARTAYLKVYGLDAEANDIYSELITINQAAYVAPSDVVYKKVTKTTDITDGQYLIVYEDLNVAFDGSLTTLDAAGNTIDVEINDDNTISGTSETEAAEFTINVTEGSLMSASGKYIGVSSWGNGIKPSDTSDYKNSFAIEEGNAIISIEFSSGNMILNYNSDSNQKRFRYYKNGSQQPIQLYKKVVEEENITIGSAGYATYVTKKAIKINPHINAYAVLAINETKTSVALDKLTEVPASTPIIVEGAEGEYPCTVIENAESPATNLLKVSTGVTGDGATFYALANKDQGVGFYPVGNGIEVPAGKAYLEIPPTMSVKGFLALGGVADAINNIAVETANGTIFNIAGQKVQNITKGGLYIVNGKKVVVK